MPPARSSSALRTIPSWRSCTIRSCLEAGLAKTRQNALLAPGEGGAGAWQAHRRYEPRAAANTGAPTSRSRTARSPSPSPAPIRRPRARGIGTRPLQLLAVGSIVPRKAYDTLVRALAAAEGPRLAARHRWAQPTAARRRSLRCIPPSARPGLPSASRCVGAGRHRKRWLTTYAAADLFAHAVALRRLRHGAGGSHGARPADRLHHWRRARPRRVPDAAAIKVRSAATSRR